MPIFHASSHSKEIKVTSSSFFRSTHENNVLEEIKYLSRDIYKMTYENYILVGSARRPKLPPLVHVHALEWPYRCGQIYKKKKVSLYFV